MALSKADFNNINVTPAASKKIKWNASANGFETGDVGGSIVLLSTQTADGSGTAITFDSGIDSTYNTYLFKYINIHPQTDNVDFNVNFRDGSTAYDAVKTTHYFYSYHNESGSEAALTYYTSGDLAQGTGVQLLSGSTGNGNDECLSGEMFLYNPSSTTFVTHFMATNNTYHKADYSQNRFVGGYCDGAAAIDGVQFSISSGNIDSGTFKMYGIT